MDLFWTSRAFAFSSFPRPFKNVKSVYDVPGDGSAFFGFDVSESKKKEVIGMKIRFAIVLLPVLLGCGDSTPPKSAEKPKIAPEPPPVVVAPEPPPRLPDAPPPLKATDISRPSATEGSSTQAAPDKIAPSVPNALPTKKPVDEFDPDVVGGKPIGAYVKMLDSANRDDVIEALALRLVPRKAEKNLDKITELSKNKDKEIAEEAALTLKAIAAK